MQSPRSTEYTNQAEYSKLSNIFLDVGFLCDPKILGLLDQWGDRGLTALLALYAALATERGATLRRFMLRAVLCQSRGWSKEDAESFLDSCVSLELLIADGELLICERLQAEQKAVARRQKKWRDAKTPTEIPKPIPRGILSEAIEESSELLNKEQRTKNKEILKENCEPSLQLPEPESDDPYIKLTQDHLEPPTGSNAWERGNAFMLGGRRPFKKYPEIRLSPPELAEIFRQYDKAGIPRGRFKEAVLAVKARMVGKNPETVSAFNWFTEFGKKNLIESLITEKRLAKVEGRA